MSDTNGKSVRVAGWQIGLIMSLITAAALITYEKADAAKTEVTANTAAQAAVNAEILRRLDRIEKALDTKPGREGR